MTKCQHGIWAVRGIVFKEGKLAFHYRTCALCGFDVVCTAEEYDGCFGLREEKEKQPMESIREVKTCFERIGVEDRTVIFCTLPLHHEGPHHHVQNKLPLPERLVPRISGSIRSVPLEERTENVLRPLEEPAGNLHCNVCGATVDFKLSVLHESWHKEQDDRWNRRHEP